MNDTELKGRRVQLDDGAFATLLSGPDDLGEILWIEDEDETESAGHVDMIKAWYVCSHCGRGIMPGQDANGLAGGYKYPNGPEHDNDYDCE